MTLENLVGKGLMREASSVEEIRRLFARIETKLNDAKNNDVSFDSRFDLAYEALLQIGLAALRANGLRPDSRGGHHMLALQTLDKTIDYPREKLRVLDEYRRQRSAGLYDGTFQPSEMEVSAILKSVMEVKDHFHSWLVAHFAEFNS